jgi:hypothetical protein
MGERFKSCETVCRYKGPGPKVEILVDERGEWPQYSCSIGKEDCPVLYLVQRVQALYRPNRNQLLKDLEGCPFDASKPSP